jgi:hypothetical protein
MRMEAILTRGDDLNARFQTWWDHLRTGGEIARTATSIAQEFVGAPRF